MRLSFLLITFLLHLYKQRIITTIYHYMPSNMWMPHTYGILGILSIFIYICIYKCVYIYTHVYMCVHTHTHTYTSSMWFPQQPCEFVQVSIISPFCRETNWGFENFNYFSKVTDLVNEKTYLLIKLLTSRLVLFITFYYSFV